MNESWTCPYCPWYHEGHYVYGWTQVDDHAVEVHKTKLCPVKNAYIQGWNNALYWTDTGRDPSDMPEDPYTFEDNQP